MQRILIILAITLALSGCLRRQTYSRPDMPVPRAWPASATTQPDSTGAPSAAGTTWQVYFADAKLQSVIELALANNRDLRSAALNVEKVQAMYRIQRAQQFPTVGASATGNIYRLPESMVISGITVEESINIAQYNINGGITSWELDLFGRIRSLKTAALERFVASQQARSATQVALVAAVANSYVILGADRESLRVARATFDAQQSSLDLIQQIRDAGIASDLEVNQARSQVEAARADIVRYSAQVDLDENALNLLAGAPVAADLLPEKLASDDYLQDVAPGVPSEVLLRRPDILMAEHQLVATYANIDAARAAYFPRIALTANAGVLSSSLDNLFRGSAGTWTFAPAIGLPIFDYGTRKANVKIAQVDRDLALASYEKSIQSAFREVSDSLTLRSRLKEQIEAQQSLVKSLEATYQLSDTRYKSGIDSYLSVLVAQRSLYAAQQGLVSLRAARLGNLVTLYKVLGGGAS